MKNSFIVLICICHLIFEKKKKQASNAKIQVTNVQELLAMCILQAELL